MIKAHPNNFILEERVTSTTGGKSLYVKNAKGKQGVSREEFKGK
jgi:hypothetical protein